MKYIASKKTIIILTISGLFLLLGVIGIVLQEPIKNGLKYGHWFTIDSYQELLEHCEVQRTKGRVSLKCKGLIEAYKREATDNKAKYTVLIIPKEKSKNLFRIKIEEEDEKVEWVNPYEDYLSLIPINISITFNKGQKLNYLFNKITFNLMSEEEVLDLIETDSRISDLSNRIMRKYYSGYQYSNIYPSQVIGCVKTTCQLQSGS